MQLSDAINKIRFLFLIVLLIFIWLLLGMVWIDRFVPPFDRIMLLLMPWKSMDTIHTAANISKRLSIMQEVLDASNRIANYTLLIMIISFSALSIYLTLIYQQKQRRANENRLLLLKNQEIMRRNEFIRYISATIGHEFKNNLGRIKRRVDLLSDIPQDARERIDENMDKLFADIDIFKKISDEREAGLVDFTKINLREMLAELTSQYSDLADFTFEEKMPPPALFASKTLLRTVFENLIDNSIKYKKPGQSRAKISLSCSLDVDGKRRYVSLAFRDEGIGMDEQPADICFYKGKSTTDGWGEGLYFVKYVIGLHAGKIRVGKEYTAPGKGTEIIINLPFVEEALDV
ncbi:MAG: HAMP domain-containing histidine kinase [Nitrospirae bacterium]|nr:HAMP domain-containing histidine kinase [Nitrospirota bacterium]